MRGRVGRRVGGLSVGTVEGDGSAIVGSSVGGTVEGLSVGSIDVSGMACVGGDVGAFSGASVGKNTVGAGDAGVPVVVRGPVLFTLSINLGMQQLKMQALDCRKTCCFCH